MIEEKVYHLGLIGYQLSHSVSPAIHQAALEEFAFSGEYQLFSASPLPQGETEIKTILGKMRIGIIDGINVTIPHKRSVLPYVDELNGTARDIQAVNTIFMEDGKLIGDNTDVNGFLEDIHQIKPSYNRAFVLGAGGAARAVVYALVKSGCSVWIYSRRIEQARELILDLQRLGNDFKQRTFVLNDVHEGIHSVVQACDLIVNATPSGMYPHVNESPWMKGALFPRSAILYDLVYNPKDTLLMQQARATGLTVANGLGMLVRQAALAFEHWTGKRPSFDRLYRAAEADLVTRKHIIEEQ